MTMKRFVSVFVSVLLVLMMLPMGAISAVTAEEQPESVVINVKDCGAVGDGKTDDRAAIIEAFRVALYDYMRYAIPVTVYFPEGQYGLLNGGMYINLPRGYGNLTVKGDGADKSTLVYLDEWTNNGSWVALRIFPKITPESPEQYLHDITIQDLGVYDTDPLKHAWHPDKGDPGKEETHGFNIQYCVRATIKNCKVDSVGDEAIDMSHCVDSVMRDNLVLNSPGAGSAGGSISVGDGSKNVLITNNTVIGSINNPDKTNWAIAVEALTEYVEDIEISNNVIQNIAGWGMNLGAPNGTMSNIVVHHNTIDHCRDGGIRSNGAGRTTNVQMLDNSLTNVRYGILLDGSHKEGTLIDRCVIENATDYAISIGSTSQRDTVVRNTTIRNARWRAIYNAGINTLVDRVLIDGSGTAGGVTDSAIIQYASGGDCTISNSVLLNCQNKRGIQGVSKVINTYIQQPEISGYAAMNGCMWIENCWVNRMITVKSGCTVDGLVLYTEVDLGTHAIVLSNLTDCTIKNCLLTMPSRYGISEAGTANNNVITNNVCIGGSGIKTVGADTVVTDNVRATLAKTEQFAYRVVDGNAIVMAPVDAALTALTIPATIDGCPVTAIDPWAFARCEKLATVSIPDTLTAVGTHAFFDCPALATVNYGGLEAQREALAIGAENTALTSAAWTYHWQNHNYDNACDSTCNDCDFIREVGEHVYTASCDADCNACGFMREADDHVYDNACDAVCGACGFTRVVPDHAYGSVVTAPDCVSGGYTTYTCAVCGDTYVSDETAALGHAYDNACDAACNVCGFTRDVPDHIYDDDKDADCNECGAVRTVSTPGDANGDGAINNRDLALLQQYINKWEIAIDVDAMDVNDDGAVNNRDLALLQQYINKWDVTLQ